MAREDKDQFLNSISLGFLPAGTGNGLVKSLLHESDENFSVLNAAYTVIKGRKKKMDMTELELEYLPNKKIYMFLSLSWAIFADIDIGSECLRCLGKNRILIWAIYRLISLRTYPGKLSFSGFE